MDRKIGEGGSADLAELNGSSGLMRIFLPALKIL